MKTLKDISWQVTEEEYRTDPALSYSTLAKFAREGFNNLDTLFDRIDTPSLTFGSAVDAIVTGGLEEFDKNFFVADFPNITDSVEKVMNELFMQLGGAKPSDDDVLRVANELKYQQNWKAETRVKVLKEQGFSYYMLLQLAKGRKVVNSQFKEDVDNCVTALRTSPATAKYFNPFTPLEVNYQLKFKATFGGIDYRCMADMIVVDHENKVVYPIDLKTSGHPEWDFFDSFVKWRYDIQARLYWRIIRDNMDKDEQYKDYQLDHYRFIVVNRKTLTPLVWQFNATKSIGMLMYGTDHQYVLDDPFNYGKELSYYLSSRPSVPIGINLDKENDITEWLNSK